MRTLFWGLVIGVAPRNVRKYPLRGESAGLVCEVTPNGGVRIIIKVLLFYCKSLFALGGVILKKVMFVVLIMMLLLAMAIPAFAAPAEKVDVCHLTSSETNEWVVININDNAWETHDNHGDKKIGVDVDENCEPLILTCTVKDGSTTTAIYEVPEGGFVADGTQYYPLSSTNGNVSYLYFSGVSGWNHFPADLERKTYPVVADGTDCAITPILYP